MPLGSPSFGGALTTAGGLVFIPAARATTLRAFDVETGTTLWAGDLPASAPATPMKYRSASGKQFIEIAGGDTPRWRRSAATGSFALTLP